MEIYRHEITELDLYIENTRAVARAYYFPTLRMIARHYDRGQGDYEKGIKAISRFTVLPAARQYLLEHGSMTDSVRDIFPKAMRDIVATGLMERFLDSYREADRFWQ